VASPLFTRVVDVYSQDASKIHKIITPAIITVLALFQISPSSLFQRFSFFFALDKLRAGGLGGMGVVILSILSLLL
jgi:hypothetical protein